MNKYQALWADENASRGEDGDDDLCFGALRRGAGVHQHMCTQCMADDQTSIHGRQKGVIV